MVTRDEKILDQYAKAQAAAVVEIVDQGLATLATLVDSGAIDVSPSFQRRDRWNSDRQSKLVESFLANIPVPPVYLAEDAASLGSYAVIDGKQRLTAIALFFTDRLELKDLVRFPDMNGMRYSDLPLGVRTNLGMKSLRVITLLRQSNEELKHEVFLRLNTGGEVLNAQEIRNVAYRGPLNELVYSLAENSFLRKQFKVTSTSSPAYRQMIDAEFVLRFLSLANSWRTFKGDIRLELDGFMLQHRFADEVELNSYSKGFARTITAAESIWGDDAFKRPGRDQALAGLFDAQMIALFEMSKPQLEILTRERGAVISKTNALFNETSFDEAVRQGTNTPTRLRLRTERMLETLRGIAK